VDKSDVREWVSVAAVVVGLVFVGYELRQNTKVQRISATQTLAAEYADALEAMAYEGEAACVYALGINGVDNLSDDERLRFFVMMFEIFRSAEQLHYYAVEGMVEPRIWRGFERQVTEVASLPGVQEWWSARRAWFSDEFQEFLDSTIAAGPTVEPQRYLEHTCFDRGIGRHRGDSPD
jgi:hypothetical protein